MTFNQFCTGLHKSSQLLSTGTATVLGSEFPAALVRNMYGQELVWGEFGFERKKSGDFKKWTGLSNNAATSEVIYETTDRI